MSKVVSTIVVIDDEAAFRDQLKSLLSIKCGCSVLTFEDGRDAYPIIDKGGVAVVLLDWMMPYAGEKVLRELTDRSPETRVIVMTALNDVPTAVSAMKHGAKDFIPKPFDKERLLSVVRSSLENFELRRDYQMLKNKMLEPELVTTTSRVVFRSAAIHSLLLIIEGLSQSRHPVLISGETGVGKEVFARAIHESSGVKGQFVAVNAAGLDDFAFSDTLFGHRKGAFTGATTSRDGLIRQAEGGTLFLDEIGDLAPESQVKLLRFLQEGEFYRLGSDAVMKADVRIVTATNADLSKNGKFRQDLYFRLRTHNLAIPPLRDRMEDVPVLVNHFLKRAAAIFDKPIPEVTSDLLYAFQGYSFPGNVRELENIINDMVTLNRTGVLSAKDVPFDVPNTHAGGLGDEEIGQLDSHPLSRIYGRFPTIDEMEEYMIEEVLRVTDGNQSNAAKILGMSRPTLNKRLKAREQSQ